MKAKLIACTLIPEPQRHWTNLGPKTIEEILVEVAKPKSKLNYGMLSQEAKDLVEAHIVSKKLEEQAKTEAEAKKEQIERWRHNKALGARLQKRRR